jgi:hypothetical protein
MAKNLTYRDLLRILRSPEEIQTNPFEILHEISSFVNNPEKENIGRDLVLRALEYKKYFKNFEEILNALVREVGLFPYLNKDKLGLKDLIAYEYHKPIVETDGFVFHREQAFVYRKLLAGESVVLSAPTSFGKSRIVDEVIRLKKFQNIAIIVPTIALIDETRKRLAKFSSDYKLISQVGQKVEKRNLFIFTAERAIAYGKLPKIHFFVIDEFYKLGGAIDQERAVSLNQVFYKLLKNGGQFLLLGPNIREVPGELAEKYRCYIYPTKFTTVASDQVYVGDVEDKEVRLVEICKELKSPTLIFCSSPKKVNEIARLLSESLGIDNSKNASMESEWIGLIYHPKWIFCQSLLSGVGIHHGRLPRSLAQHVVKMFNDFKIRFLICTSTLIEGVNTKAKNVIVYDNEIARKKIDFFTFNNIKGRSGRMFEHFVGKVFLFDPPPQVELPFVDVPIVTQNESAPDSLLIQMSEDDLSDRSKERIDEFMHESVLPLDILRSNSGISPSDQMIAAKRILKDKKFSLLQWKSLPTWDSLEYLCDIIWVSFIKTKRNGVSSSRQLAFKLSDLSRMRNLRSRINSELTGPYAAASVDEAIERILQFDRNWASYDFPRFLMALDAIQRYILTSVGQPCGDYKFYASRVESLFKHPLLKSLDEFGIPFEIGLKLVDDLGLPEDIDIALKMIKSSRIDKADYKPFELILLNEALQSM